VTGRERSGRLRHLQDALSDGGYSAPTTDVELSDCSLHPLTSLACSPSPKRQLGTCQPLKQTSTNQPQITAGALSGSLSSVNVDAVVQTPTQIEGLSIRNLLTAGGAEKQPLVLRRVRDLYDQHLYLQAYRESIAYWRPTTVLAGLSLDELILGGRLAARLGGSRLSRWLYRAAYARDRSSPHVRYYCARLRLRGWNPFDHLRAFEEQPDLGGDDIEVRASWLAWQAVTWASLRDFTRAEACIERAHSLAGSDSWVWSCESQVRGLADRWEDALRAAERAWEISPGAPYAAHSLGDS